MNYSVYADYLKEAGLYEGFRDECAKVSWLLLNPDMILISSPAFLYEHCSNPLDQVIDELFGPKMRVHPYAGQNYDILVYFKWLLVFLHLEMADSTAKEAQEVQRYHGKNKDLLVQDLENTKRIYDDQEKRVIEFLMSFGQKESAELLPDEAISLYRELWKLSCWNKESQSSRPSFEELRTLRPLIVDSKYHIQSDADKDKAANKPEIVHPAKIPPFQAAKIPPFKPDFKNAGEQLAKGIQEKVGDFQRLAAIRRSDTHKVEEKIRRSRKAFEIQEMMEYVSFMDLLISNCAKKYFV